MSALGQEQTLPVHLAMSALPPKADIERHLVDQREQPVWNLKAERLRGLEIDGQFELPRLLNGKIGRLGGRAFRKGRR